MKDPAQPEAQIPTKRAPIVSAMRRRRVAIMVALPVLAVAALAWFWLTGGRTEATDNAYVQAARVAISPSVPGRVIGVNVRENDHVTAGDILFTIDKPGYEAAVSAAEAQLGVARTRVSALLAAYKARQASLVSAQEALAFAQSEAERKRNLAKEGISSKQELDAAEYAVTDAKAAVDAAQQAVSEALAELGGQADIAIEDHPLVREAAARLSTAKLDLEHTDVRAPQDGVVTRVDQVQVGSYVNAGQTMFWLVAGEPWVEANFKEDQLKEMKVGQVAHIRIDAHPEYELEARVSSFSPGTGAVFSPLPPQNATGNWVKVVQRLPVRLTFVGLPEGLDLQAGLSAHAKVDVKSEPDAAAGTRAAALRTAGK